MRATEEGPIEYVLHPPTGGVDRRTYPTEMQENKYFMLQNLEVSESLRAFVTRKGQTEYVSANGSAGGGVRFYYGSNGRITVISTNDGLTIKRWTGAAWSTLYSYGAGPGGSPSGFFFAGYDDILYGAPGSNTGARMVRVDPSGPTARSAGFRPSASGPVLATGAAGALTGAYYYGVSFIYDGNTSHESTVTRQAASVSPSSQKVDLSTIPVGGPSEGVTARKIYRSRAGGIDLYYLTTINDNTTTTYTDNAADSSLGADLAPNDNGVPPDGAERMVFWNGRMVVSIGRRLYFSAITSTERSPNGSASIHGAGVEIFPASHFIDVGDDNRTITQLVVQQGQLVVFKDDQVWNLSGETARDFRAWRSISGLGCCAPRSIVSLNGLIFFAGMSDGSPNVYAYDGFNAQPIAGDIEPYIVDTVIRANLAASVATIFRGRYLLSYQLTGGGSGQMVTADYDFQLRRWQFHRGPNPKNWIHFNGPGDSGELYYVSSGYFYGGNDGKLLQWENKQTEYNNGSDLGGGVGLPGPVTATIETMWLDLRAPYQQKQMRFIEIYCKIGEQPDISDPQPGNTLLTVARSYDLSTTEITTNCNAKNITSAKKLGNLCKVRIACGGSDQSSPEKGFLVKLKITMQGPLEIFKIVLRADREEKWKEFV